MDGFVESMPKNGAKLMPEDDTLQIDEQIMCLPKSYLRAKKPPGLAAREGLFENAWKR